MSDDHFGVYHEHPQAEFDAPAWDLHRLREHMKDMHGIEPRTGDLMALAAIHAAEHPEAAGILRAEYGRLPERPVLFSVSYGEGFGIPIVEAEPDPERRVRRCRP